MLPKENRLRLKNDFQAIFDNGKKLKGRNFQLFVYHNNERENQPPRVGIIVSKKVSKKAVTRNKVKRKLREIVRLNIKDIPDGSDSILIAFRGIADSSYRELDSQFIKLISEISK